MKPQSLIYKSHHGKKKPYFVVVIVMKGNLKGEFLFIFKQFKFLFLFFLLVAYNMGK
jgi:hypothetical protein